MKKMDSVYVGQSSLLLNMQRFMDVTEDMQRVGVTEEDTSDKEN